MGGHIIMEIIPTLLLISPLLGAVPNLPGQLPLKKVSLPIKVYFSRYKEQGYQDCEKCSWKYSGCTETKISGPCSYKCGEDFQAKHETDNHGGAGGRQEEQGEGQESGGDT